MTHTSMETSGLLAVARLDQSMYAILKLYVYGQLLAKLPTARPDISKDPAILKDLPLVGARITARKLRKLLESQPGAEDGLAFSDLFQGSSQFCYQRLLSLNHARVLKAVPGRLRRNRVFFWNEPLVSKNLCTVEAVRHHVTGRHDLAVEALGIYEAFGEDAFSQAEYVEASQARLLSISERHEAGRRLAKELPHSARFPAFLARRLTQMLQAGLVERHGPESYKLSAKGFEVGLYLDLFIHNIGFSEPVQQCRHCRDARTVST